jgi:hypothetical protein
MFNPQTSQITKNWMKTYFISLALVSVQGKLPMATNEDSFDLGSVEARKVRPADVYDP